jgi:hypothetical protein
VEHLRTIQADEADLHVTREEANHTGIKRVAAFDPPRFYLYPGHFCNMARFYACTLRPEIGMWICSRAYVLRQPDDTELVALRTAESCYAVHSGV